MPKQGGEGFYMIGLPGLDVEAHEGKGVIHVLECPTVEVSESK